MMKEEDHKTSKLLEEEGSEEGEDQDEPRPKLRSSFEGEPPQSKKLAAEDVEDEDELRDTIDDVSNEPAKLHFLLIFDSNLREDYLKHAVTKQFEEKQLELGFIKRNICKQKIDNEGIYNTNFTEAADWTSIHSRTGLYICGLYSKHLPLISRVHFLGVAWS